MALKLKSYLSGNDFLNRLNEIACFICIWFIFFPYPFMGLFCTLAFIPILGITRSFFLKIMRFSNPINNEADKDKEVHNTVPLYIIAPSIVLAVKICLKFDCENYYSLLLCGGIAVFIFGIIFLLNHLPLKAGLIQQTKFYAILAACTVLYSYGVIFGMNCLFDKSAPERFVTRIVAKHSEGGGDYPSVLYYVTVAPWENHLYQEDLQISEEEYELADTGDYIFIHVQKGLLNIPWYYRAPRN